MKLPSGSLPLCPYDGIIEREPQLPYPYVCYPKGLIGIITFQKNKNSKKYCCSCQKKAIKTLLNHPFYLKQDIKEELLFEDGLCHICNKVIPKYGYTKMHYGCSRFYTFFGLYITTKYYEYGFSLFGDVLEPNQIPTDLAGILVMVDYFPSRRRLDEQSRIDLRRYCENKIREQVGYHQYGRKWKNETKLYDIIKQLFPDYHVISQYELDYLRCDVFIEELNLVVEYQGEQHFKAFKYMGGEEALQQRKAKDREKKEICDYYNLELVYFTYKDKITKELVEERLKHYIK